MDDFDLKLCGSKHYGPVLGVEGNYQVMRCSFCEQIFRTLIEGPFEVEVKLRSSKTCISACDWTVTDNMVKCNACSYWGPRPNLPQV